MPQKYSLEGAHKVWLDGELIPQTPAKITYEYPDNTEIIRLANEGNFTVAKYDSPIKISFEFKATYDEYPFTWGYSDGADPIRESWTDKLWYIKVNRKPIRFDVQRKISTINVSMKVLLTDWNFVEDAEDRSDLTISVNLIEYCPQMNLETDASVEHHLIQNREARGWAAKRSQ